MDKQKQINKLTTYASLCIMVEKTIDSIGNLHKANRNKLKTYIFNKVANAAKKV